MYLNDKALKVYNNLVTQIENGDIDYCETKELRFWIKGYLEALTEAEKITCQEACSILLELIVTDLI